MAISATSAGRHPGAPGHLLDLRTYRESMAEFSELKTLELWYRALAAEELIAGLPSNLRKLASRPRRREKRWTGNPYP